MASLLGPAAVVTETAAWHVAAVDTVAAATGPCRVSRGVVAAGSRDRPQLIRVAPRCIQNTQPRPVSARRGQQPWSRTHVAVVHVVEQVPLAVAVAPLRRLLLPLGAGFGRFPGGRPDRDADGRE